MSIDNPQTIIAYDFRHPEKSAILRQNIVGSRADVLSEMEVTAFIGRGIWICEARVIESVNDAEDFACEINLDGKLTAFEIVSIIRFFPLVEGDLAAGICQFHESEPDYYEIKDALALSELFSENPNFDSETEKLVCSPDGISLLSIEDGAQLNFYERHPLSFFDIYCPLCREKVMTYEIDSESLRCQPLALSCPHFAGHAVWSAAGYESETLKDLKANYKLVGENLYFETRAGWQKPVIYAPPPNPQDSFWSGALQKQESGFADHFFFLESEPQFWIR